MGKEHVLSDTIWLADIADYAAMNKVWAVWVSPEHPPPRACGKRGSRCQQLGWTFRSSRLTRVEADRLGFALRGYVLQLVTKGSSSRKSRDQVEWIGTRGTAPTDAFKLLADWIERRHRTSNPPPWRALLLETVCLLRLQRDDRGEPHTTEARGSSGRRDNADVRCSAGCELPRVEARATISKPTSTTCVCRSAPAS